MKRHLENLRAQPYHVRKRIAFFVTGTLSLLVFGVWWSVFTNDPNRTQRMAAESQGKTLSPVTALSNTISAQTDTFMGAISVFNDVSKKFEEEAKKNGEDFPDGSVVYPDEVFTTPPPPPAPMPAPTPTVIHEKMQTNPAPSAIPPVPELPDIGE
jgi:hypothetical protein